MAETQARVRKPRKAVSAEVVDITKRGQESNDATKRALGGVRARTVGVTKQIATTGAAPGQSQVTGEDPFTSFAQRGLVIESPFDMLTLAMLPEQNSELTQTIEAMTTNIEGTGHRFISRVNALGKTTPDDIKKKVRQEHVKLQNFFMYATRESFVEFRMKLRRDLESTGNCYYEVIRDVKGHVQAFQHMPSYQVRLGRMEDEPILYDRDILELQEDGSVKVAKVPEWRRFRRFVQSRFVSSRGLNTTVQGHKVRWFKEFGDPRHYDSATGNVISEEDLDNFKPEKRANEIVRMELYSPRSPYGLPRFIGNLLSIFGDRAAEEINYVTFRNNNIPSMVVLVSNGQLTEGSIGRIESFVESAIQGSDNYSKFLIIEGEPTAEEGEDGGQVKVEIQPLVNNQIKDALFQNYSGNNQDKIRRCYRLPPIFVGRSDDYTRATAESSRKLADEQIFAPERMRFDDMMNRVLFPAMGIIFHQYKSNTPNTTDNTQLVKILASAEKTGGVTPRIAKLILEDIMGMELPDPDESFPLDVPFSLTMAEAVKNQAEASEPGQQVTALKALGFLTDDDGDLDDEATADAAERLLFLNKRVEKLWRERVALSED
jgi:PBSX family phage portal protein